MKLEFIEDNIRWLPSEFIAEYVVDIH